MPYWVTPSNRASRICNPKAIAAPSILTTNDPIAPRARIALWPVLYLSLFRNAFINTLPDLKKNGRRATCILRPILIKVYSTTIAVLLDSPSPTLLTAMMRYSSSLPLGCSTSVASLITAVATSSQAPAGRSLILQVYFVLR